jgi:hypothetical protein
MVDVYSQLLVQSFPNGKWALLRGQSESGESQRQDSGGAAADPDTHVVLQTWY